MNEVMQLNLVDFIPGSTYFRWKDALWVPKWGVTVFPSKEQYDGIIKLATRLELPRGFLGPSWTVTSWLRPKYYNEWKDPYGVGGSQRSAHMEGLAIDFQVFGMNADTARNYLKANLEMYKLRMEDLPGSNWIHLDARDPIMGNRFFKP